MVIRLPQTHASSYALAEQYQQPNLGAAITTIGFGIMFELIRFNINKSRVPDVPHDWVFVLLNGMYVSARLVFTGYGFWKLLPYLVSANALISEREMMREEGTSNGVRELQAGKNGS